MSSWHPELIPINREEDYHTHYLGETASGNLFFGYETFVFPNGLTGPNWQEERLMANITPDLNPLCLCLS
jgi:hypothetical protein